MEEMELKGLGDAAENGCLTNGKAESGCLDREAAGSGCLDRWPRRLYETSLLYQGARTILRQAWEDGSLRMDSTRGHDGYVYSEAIYEMLMRDDIALEMYMAGGGTVVWEYYDWEKDKKGRLVKCKARRRGTGKQN